MNIKDAYLTTKDNPYSYSKQFDEWLAFDESKGYFTNQLVARIADNYIISELYSIERVSEYIERVYFIIIDMFPDLYELRSD